MAFSPSPALPEPFLPFDDPSAELETVGGKGANLAKLSLGGFPVPPGFLVPTSAYKSFVEANGLNNVIATILEKCGDSQSDPQKLEDASKEIRAAFSAHASLDEAFSSSLSDALRWLGSISGSVSGPVAVRSSATAEDLPDLSFAGQQDTYLNVLGEAEFIRAVVDCWSSLWTARAIGYRNRNDISHHDVALCVVVQNMVQSESSGVMFTANPLTGKRGEVAIDATLGLGEALVGGLVEPDHYVVDASSATGGGGSTSSESDGKVDFIIVKKTLGSKSVQIRGVEGGGVSTEDRGSESAQAQAMTDDIILALARMGKAIEEYYNFPQDVEFGVTSAGEIRILQSRPITSLYPLPLNMPPDPLRVMFGFHLIQGVLEPYTPLGQNSIQELLGGFAGLATLPGEETFYVSGERLWMNVTPVLCHPFLWKFFKNMISGMEPTAPGIIDEMLKDPRIASRERSSLSWRSPFGILARIPRVVRCLLWPEYMARETLDCADEYIARAAAENRPTGNMAADFRHTVKLLSKSRTLFPHFIGPTILPATISGVGPFLGLLRRYSQELVEVTGDKKFKTLSLEIAKGIPNNVTTEMDLMLWRTAQTLKSDSKSLGMFESLPATELAARYLEGSLPTVAQGALSDFLDLYGARGLGEIDIGRPRWRDEPEHVMGTLKSYLQIEDPKLAPTAVFERGAEEAKSAAKDLEDAVRSNLRFGWFKATLVQWAVRRFRALGGLRELHKFVIVRMMGLQHAGLLESGKRMKDLGWLNEKDDLFFLDKSEVEDLAVEMDGWTEEDAEPASLPSLRVSISERRETRARELRRKQIPRFLLSDGTSYYEGVRAPESAADGAIMGDPVSPGSVEGVVRVVFNPLGTDLKPGEILVCPGTDPAWTPLFLAAHGLVMEVGGMMTHGSVVAREYGIPAVVGVHEATSRLKTGQRIRLDGSSGIIEILG